MPRVGIIGRIGLVIATGSALVASVAIAQTAPGWGPCPMGPGVRRQNIWRRSRRRLAECGPRLGG